MPQLDLYVFASVFLVCSSLLGGLLSMTSGSLQEFVVSRVLDGTSGRLYYYHLSVLQMLSIRKDASMLHYYYMCNQILCVAMQQALRILSTGFLYRICL